MGGPEIGSAAAASEVVDGETAESDAVAGAAPSGSSGRASSGTGATLDNSKLPNGGATASGVTAKEIVIGVASVDPSVLAPVCPACDPGQANSGAPAQAMVERFIRDGLLPVNGRAVKIVNRKVGLTADEQRSACVFFAQEVKPFLVLTGAGTSGVGACLAGEFKIPVLDPYGGYKESTVQRNYPLIHVVAPMVPRIMRNTVYWADEKGLLKGHKVGLISADDTQATSLALGVENPSDQTSITKNFRDVLAKKGSKVEVDAVLKDINGNDAAPFVGQMKALGVDVVFSLTGSATKGFQDAAEQQGFRPRYIVPDLTYQFGEAGAAYFNPENNDGALGISVRWWNPSRRSPPQAADNPAAQYCFEAYGAYTKKPLDTFKNSSEMSLTLDICTGMQVLMPALKAAGSNLTVERYIGGLQTIKNLQTAEYLSVTFAPGKYAGSDLLADASYTKQRHQPSNLYWATVGRWRPMFVP